VSTGFLCSSIFFLDLTPPLHVLVEGPACRRAPLVVLVALLLEDDLAADPSGIIRAA